MGELPANLRNNPLFDVNEEFHYMPSWDKIKLSHFLPAFEYALVQAYDAVEDIIYNPARPNFKNTAEALATSDELVGSILQTFYNYLPSPDEEDEYSEIEEEISATYAEFFNDTFTDEDLFARFLDLDDRIYKQKHSKEKMALFEMYYNTFLGAGIEYGAKKQAKIAEIGQRISSLEIKIQRNMSKAQDKTVLVKDKKQLRGLPEDILDEAAERAKEQGQKGAWAFVLHEVPYMTVISSAESRKLRERMWRAYHARGTQGKHDNRDLIIELVTLRHRLAKMTGERSYAHEELKDTAARKPKNVGKFLQTLKKHAKPRAQEEIKILSDYARAMDGLKDFKPWDLHYYAETLREDMIGYDEEEARPYFELDNVVQGNLDHLGKLFGVSFTEMEGYPVYHKDVRVFEVKNQRNGAHVGVIMMDLLARDGKGTGIAWDSSVVSQGLFEGQERRPIDVVVAKFQKGTKGEPTLLSHYDVLTLFHELGHAMHNMLSQCRYQTFSGTDIQRDYVEFPSQLQENWAYEPEVLDSFARHYKTGEKMPDELKLKLKQSRKFMTASTEVLPRAARGWLDLQWAQANADSVQSVEEFEQKALKDFELFPDDPGLWSTHFSYIFGGGYDAGFYGYQYSAQSEADWFEFFQRKGLYDQDAARRTKEFMEKGGSEDVNPLFRKLRHRNPRPEPMLRRFGFLKDTFNKHAEPPAPEDWDFGVEDEAGKNARSLKPGRWRKRSMMP